MGEYLLFHASSWQSIPTEKIQCSISMINNELGLKSRIKRKLFETLRYRKSIWFFPSVRSFTLRHWSTFRSSHLCCPVLPDQLWERGGTKTPLPLNGWTYAGIADI